MDETILNLILPWEKVHENIGKELMKLDEKAYQEYLRRKINLSQLENSFVSKYGQKAKDLLIKSRTDFENKYLQDVVPNPDLVNFIKNIKNYKLYVWSSNSTNVVEKALGKFGIANAFEKIITGSDTLLLKPETEGFEKIYDPKTPKENYLFIGNSSANKDAAAKIGIDFFQITYFK